MDDDKIDKIIEDAIKEMEEEPELKPVYNKRFYRGLTALCLMVILGCSSYLGISNFKENQAEKQLAALAADTEIEDSQVPTAGSKDTVKKPKTLVEQNSKAKFDIPDKDIDWDALEKTNEDIYAWIYIPGTKVDYPVLSSTGDEDPDFYLDHNLDKSYGPKPGCIYSKSNYNKTDFSDYNLVLYGHNMRDGSMFKTIHNYSDQDFFDENRYIYVYTKDYSFAYEIFAAYETDDSQLFAKYNFASDYGYMQYLDEVLNQRSMGAIISDDVTPTYVDKIITLSTCINGKADARWLVQGVMICFE